jgi:hypothetical protein
MQHSREKVTLTVMFRESMERKDILAVSVEKTSKIRVI